MTVSCIVDFTNLPQMVWVIVSSAIAVASFLIKFLPELPEDSKWKPVLRFIGKFIAMNRTSADKQVKVEL